MKRMKWIAVILAAALLVGCAPTVTVTNTTSFPVRAIVASKGTRNVLSPSPGESSTAEVVEGAYRVTVIPDAEWVEYAKLTRQVLNDQLANADQLTGPQLLDVIARLKDIATRMAQYEKAAGTSSSCGGNLTSENNSGFVTISLDANGALVVICR